LVIPSPTAVLAFLQSITTLAVAKNPLPMGRMRALEQKMRDLDMENKRKKILMASMSEAKESGSTVNECQRIFDKNQGRQWAWSITTWDLFRSAFLDEYRPPLKIIKKLKTIRNFKQEPNEPLHCSWERFMESLFSCPEHKLNEHEQLQIFYKGLDAETRRKVDFKVTIPIMTPTKGIEAIKELSEHSLSWYMEGNIKAENETSLFSKRLLFGINMNIITEEVRMEQHRQKESENMVWGIKKSYDQAFKMQASSIKKIEYHLGKIAEIIQDSEARKLPSSTETKPRRLAHAITTRSELNYKPPKTPLENNTNSQEKPITNETITRDEEEENLALTKPLLTSGLALVLCHTLFSRLDLGELKSTRMCIELANKSTQYPRGIAENVIVKIDKFIFPVDFVVLDMEEDHKILIILGRPFLATAHAMIDVFNKKISFEVGNETITFDIEKSMKFSTPKDDTCLSIDMVDVAVLDHVQEILPSSFFKPARFISCSEPVINYQQRNIVNLWGDKNDEFEHEESGLSSEKDGWEPNDFIKPTLFATSTSETEAQLPKLKELSSHLEYAFLNDNHEFPGINLSFCTHKILVEDNFKPVVQPQRRLNPKVQDVVKAKIVKLIDVGLIYAISDSPWVSPIHVVPRKGGMTDGFSGYFPIPLALEDQEKTTFTCPYGTFSYRRMLFGLCNAPATFQRCMMDMSIFRTIEIKDKKGTENLVAGHLSRLENPELEKLNEEAIRDSFPDEHLMTIHVRIIRRCVFGKELQEILEDCHTGPAGGHYGADITARKIFEPGFYWPTIFKDAARYVREWDACQRAGNISSRNQIPLSNILVSKVFDIWGIDFMGPFLSSRNNKYILVAVDYVSKWVEAEALPTNDARVVVRFFQKLFSRFSVPKALISDRRTHLCNSLLEKTLKKCEVTYRLATPYHP
ncbi:reverse transcriptase domain-containing protein, partial [Tanacetum coccineum]